MLIEPDNIYTGNPGSENENYKLSRFCVITCILSYLACILLVFYWTPRSHQPAYLHISRARRSNLPHKPDWIRATPGKRDTYISLRVIDHFYLGFSLCFQSRACGRPEPFFPVPWARPIQPLKIQQINQESSNVIRANAYSTVVSICSDMKAHVCRSFHILGLPDIPSWLRSRQQRQAISLHSLQILLS